MDCPATLIKTIDGRTFRVGAIELGQVLGHLGNGRFGGISPSAPGLHATTHQFGGTDPINVTGLVGLLATAQTPAAHVHVEADVTGLVAALAGKAASVHTHAEADVTGLVADLATLTTTVAARELTANKGVASGYASLDTGAKVPIAQIPDPLMRACAPGSFTIPTGKIAIVTKLQLTGAQRVTLQGTSRLRLI